ncbi:hypothetical protein PGB90_000054 [Kerria lacca]
MRSISFFALFVCFVVCQAAPQTAVVDKYPNGYPTKFDNINLDGILNSKRLLSSYVVCLTEGKNCSPEGRTLKEILPHALQTNCVKCNEKQKNGAIKVVKVLERDHPEEWKVLLTKWDPNGKLFEEFKKTNKELYEKIFIAN